MKNPNETVNANVYIGYSIMESRNQIGRLQVPFLRSTPAFRGRVALHMYNNAIYGPTIDIHVHAREFSKNMCYAALICLYWIQKIADEQELNCSWYRVMHRTVCGIDGGFVSSLVFIDKPAAISSLSVFGTENGRVCMDNIDINNSRHTLQNKIRFLRKTLPVSRSSVGLQSTP